MLGLYYGRFSSGQIELNLHSIETKHKCSVTLSVCFLTSQRATLRRLQTLASDTTCSYNCLRVIGVLPVCRRCVSCVCSVATCRYCTRRLCAGARDCPAGFHLYPPNNSQVKRRAIEQIRLQTGYKLRNSPDVKKTSIAVSLLNLGALVGI